MKKIIITGGAGFAAQHLNPNYTRVQDRLRPFDDSIKNLLDRERPSVIINCLARCGSPTVDSCELDRSRTVEANVTIPTILATMAAERGIHLINVSSGCIFYGVSPGRSGWTETDIANPKSFYSKTKYSCDLAISDFPNVSTIRIRMPISTLQVERNYLSKILKYTKLIDIPNSMTFMDDFGRAVDWVIDNAKTGIYNLTNPEPLTPVQIVNRYDELTNFKERKIQIISEDELNAITVAPRSNAIIDNSKIINEGFSIEPALMQLDRYLKTYSSH